MALKAHQKKSFSRGSRILIAINVTLMIAIAFALFLGVCYLASLPKFRQRVDFTKDHAFSLSPMTLDLLQSLEKEVEVVSLSHAPYAMDLTGMPTVERKVMVYAGKLLEEYAISSGGMLKVEQLDRDRDNLRVQELNQKIGLGSDNTIIFLCGSNRKDLVPLDLARIDRGGVDPTTNVIQQAKVISYKTEAAITAAILSVIEEIKPKAYFTTGRREASIEDLSGEGVSFAAGMLRWANFEVQELKLYADPLVPKDCTLLAILGPGDDFSPEEIAAIRTYLIDGGRLFLSLSPDSSSSLEPLLADFGIGLNRSITCKEPSGLVISQEEGYRKSLVYATGFSAESPITRSYADSDFFVRFFKAGAVNRHADDIDVQELIWTPSDCWGDTHNPDEEGNYFFDSASEERGSRVIGVACKGKNELKEARLVFFADTHFYTNDFKQAKANLPVFSNSLNWLAARDYLLAIAPKTPYESRVDLTEEEYNEIGFYVVLIIPCIAALLGVVVWWLRRR
ncbi:MAG: Gldg family protein [Planctomycetota bacterium]